MVSLAVAGNAAQSTDLKVGGYKTWLTDAAGGDGLRMRNAIAALNNWYLAQNPRPYLPYPPIPQSLRNTMRNDLPTYNSTDAAALINLMLIRYWPAGIPTDDEALLKWLGIRAQCMEYAARTVIAAGGRPKAYSAAPVAAGSQRPGMLAFRRDLGHAAVVLDIYWNSSGVAVSYRLGESNWATGWSNPAGGVPWQRMVRTDRVVPASDYVVVSSS